MNALLPDFSCLFHPTERDLERSMQRGGLRTRVQLGGAKVDDGGKIGISDPVAVEMLGVDYSITVL